MNQLPDVILAHEIADNPEILPASPLLIEFSGRTQLHAFTGDATAENGEDVPAAQLQFVDPDGKSFVLVLNAEDLEALVEVGDRLLDEIDPVEDAPLDPEAGLGGVVP